MEQGASDFTLIFSIATVGMLLLAGSIILFVAFYQKRMLQEEFKRQQLELSYQERMMYVALESQENERRRLAGELHDSIGAMLSTIRMGITTIAKQMPDPKQLEHSKSMLDDTIASVRRISRDLMPSTLEKFGFLQATKEMCERFQSTSFLPIHYAEHGTIRSLEKKKELMLFRIVQELINNALKHAHATEIAVGIWGSDNLIVIVEDNGVGFNPEIVKTYPIATGGLGLFNIQSRAKLLGAKLYFHNKTPKGAKVTLTLPYSVAS